MKIKNKILWTAVLGIGICSMNMVSCFAAECTLEGIKYDVTVNPEAFEEMDMTFAQLGEKYGGIKYKETFLGVGGPEDDVLFRIQISC